MRLCALALVCWNANIDRNVQCEVHPSLTLEKCYTTSFLPDLPCPEWSVCKSCVESSSRWSFEESSHAPWPLKFAAQADKRSPIQWKNSNVIAACGKYGVPYIYSIFKQSLTKPSLKKYSWNHSRFSTLLVWCHSLLVGIFWHCCNVVMHTGCQSILAMFTAV